jgi:hypothetical protein
MGRSETDEKRLVTFKAPVTLIQKAKADARAADLSLSQHVRHLLRDHSEAKRG